MFGLRSRVHPGPEKHIGGIARGPRPTNGLEPFNRISSPGSIVWCHQPSANLQASAQVAAGVRHVILDLLGPYEERDRQIELFAAEGLPLLADLRGPARTPADESQGVNPS
jgi:hypothetical protein